MTDHCDSIVSISSSYDMDLYTSGSNFSCVLRNISNNEYFLTITPELTLTVKYRIYRVILSQRGYVIIQARSLFKTFYKDMLLVYTINGELVIRKELEELINDIILDKYGYYIVNFIDV